MQLVNTLLLSLLPSVALLVITIKSPVISVLSLVVYTTLLSCLLFTQGFCFVSLLYILVYVGAVAILFIFVLIIINVREADITSTGKNYTKKMPLTLAVATLTLVSFSSLLVIQEQQQNLHTLFREDNITSTVPNLLLSEIQALANALYGYSAFNLIIISLLLLTAIVGPINLCLKL